MYSDSDKKRLYDIWYGMKRRCTDPRINDYHRYGGRGISFCNEWNKFDSFYNWAILNGYKDGLSLDRIDNNGNYSPDNCQWVDWIAQANKRSTNRVIEYNGKKQTLIQWAREVGIAAPTIARRLNDGWDIQDALYGELKNSTFSFTNSKYIPNNIIQEYFNKLIIIQNGQFETLHDLSSATGVSFSTLNKWKNGEAMPLYCHVKRILSLFNVSAKDFLGNYEYVYKNNIFNKADFILYYIDFNREFITDDFNKYLNLKKPYPYLKTLMERGYIIQPIGKEGRNNIYRFISEVN